jgi:quercetin dioxygenase-like cupin family protein
MDLPYHYIPALQNQVTEVQPDSILSRTLYADDQLKIILFAFAPGQELSEHTASVPALIHILEGEAKLTLGGDSFEASPGAWARMQAHLPHSVYAKTTTKMLLVMLVNKS